MKNMEERKISRKLQQNVPPEIDPRIRAGTIQGLAAEACQMEMLPRQSILEQLLIQANYLSPWVWLVQGLLAGSFFLLPAKEELWGAILPLCLFLAPEMTVLLVCQLARSFSHNMWEMEGACRYNLPRILAMRLCLVSGADFLVLVSALVLFCRMDYPLWSFALMVPLPFFLSSALCMGVLTRHTRLRGSLAPYTDFVLCAAVGILHILLAPLLSEISIRQEFFSTAEARRGIGSATLLAMLLFLGAGARFCRGSSGHRTEKIYFEY